MYLYYYYYLKSIFNLYNNIFQQLLKRPTFIINRLKILDYKDGIIS